METVSSNFIRVDFFVYFVSNFKWLILNTHTYTHIFYSNIRMYAVKACGRERGAEIETEMNRKSIVVAFVLGIFFVVPPHRQYHFDTQPKSAYKRILKQINKSCIDRLMIFRFFFCASVSQTTEFK